VYVLQRQHQRQDHLASHVLLVKVAAAADHLLEQVTLQDTAADSAALESSACVQRDSSCMSREQVGRWSGLRICHCRSRAPARGMAEVPHTSRGLLLAS
jgi:hypothetical protein